MTATSMHTLFAPRLVNGPFGDPGLYVEFRDERRALLFDLGDIDALMPRHLMRVSHVFVSHCHMDHFAGFDRLLRVVLGRKAVVVLIGGPGLITKVAHKLHAYSWNVAHRYEVALAIEVREFDASGAARAARFSSLRRFAREALSPPPPTGDVVLDEATFRVRARALDHGVRSMAFVLEEKARLRVAKDRLATLGLGTGAWLRELKHAVLAGAPDGQTLVLRWRDRAGDHLAERTVGALREVILDRLDGQRIGYATDLRDSEANAATLEALMGGVDQLFIEAVFLDRDRDHARRKNHLTAAQAGRLARRLGAGTVVPFHFSPRYDGQVADLEAELRAARLGLPPPGPVSGP